MRSFINIMRRWVPLAAALIFLSGLVYAIAQQALRQAANDPQIQLAEDAAQALASGQPLAGQIPANQVDIAASLSPYLIYYDASGQPAAGNGYLHSRLPDFPASAFEYARAKGPDRVTWQPEPGVRSAVVLVAVPGGPGGTVLAGRSLREVESRVDTLGLLALTGCGAALAVTLVLVVLLELLPLTRAA